MKYRLRMPRPKLTSVQRRVLVAAAWLVGGGALVAFAFVASFYFATRVEMGSTEVKVPDLVGQTLEQASRIAEEEELVLQVVDQRHDPAVASGRVLQQMPPEGSPVKRGRKVKLILSLGGKVLEVPDLVGRASRAVEIELRQEGFIPGDEARVPTAVAPSGDVVAQVPPPHTPAVPNTRVHRLVSIGPPVSAWVMPDLRGLARSDAERWIASSQFRKGAVRRLPATGWPSGTVVGQHPLAGYPIRSKDVVELTVAR